MRKAEGAFPGEKSSSERFKRVCFVRPNLAKKVCMCVERVSTRLFDALFLFYLMMDVKYKFNFNKAKKWHTWIGDPVVANG